MRQVYIYALCEPGTSEVRYVGRTVQSLNKRLAHHVSNSQLNRKFHRSNWINSLLRNGLRPEIKLLVVGDESNYRDIEKLFIKYFRSTGCDLTNTTDGGDGILGYHHSEETRARMSASHLGKSAPWAKGRKLTEEHKAKINPRGRKHSEETKNKIGLGNQGKVMPREAVERIAAKLKGRKASEETRKRMSESHSKERNGMYGKKHSIEARAKISANRKKKHETEV